MAGFKLLLFKKILTHIQTTLNNVFLSMTLVTTQALLRSEEGGHRPSKLSCIKSPFIVDGKAKWTLT